MGLIGNIQSDKGLQPDLTPMPMERSKHQDEVDLERQIDAIASQIVELQQVISAKRKEEQRLSDILTKEGLVQHDQAEWNRVIRLRLSQKQELVEVIEKRKNKNQGRKGSEEVESLKERTKERQPKTTAKVSASDRKIEKNPKTGTQKSKKKASKDPDEERLVGLGSLSRGQKKKLEKVCEREDRRFERERKRAMDANEKAHRQSDARRSIKTLTKAIKFAWNEDKLEQFGQKLDRIRGCLYSEVMLNIQKSTKHHNDTLKTTQTSQVAAEALLQAQATHLLGLNDASGKRDEAVIQAIHSFTEVLESGVLFPALPQILTEADPSLKSAALHGYDQIENAVLSALYFRKMDIREAEVREAYTDTCSWIFQDPEKHQMPWNNFRRWLESENGCYWIQGKPGSGKSTLMKFIRSDSRTQTALKQWAGSDKLLTASYFFWMAGTALQKNQEGLLRSLLHTILTRRRDLIARVFPEQYNAMMAKYVNMP
jgi:hypothetical protein